MGYATPTMTAKEQDEYYRLLCTYCHCIKPCKLLLEQPTKITDYKNFIA